MNPEVSSNHQTPLVEQPIFLRAARLEIIKVGIVGFVVGGLLPIMSRLLLSWLGHFLCGSKGCSGTVYAQIIPIVAGVVLLIVATLCLAAWQVFRPLPIALAALLALWTLPAAAVLVPSSSWQFILISGVLYSLAYLLFFWLLRLHRFAMSIILVALAIIAIRLALMA